jgi:hypothetical protein
MDTDRQELWAGDDHLDRWRFRGARTPIRSPAGTTTAGADATACHTSRPARPRCPREPHRFTPTLTRQQHAKAAPHGFCHECSTQVEAWEGQAGARRYRFAAREVGEALALVARGATYRDAAFAARRQGDRLPAVRMTGGAQRRDAARDGQLVANWVDVFTEPLSAGLLPERWPEVLVIDSAELQVKSGPRRGQGFHVIGAVGREPAHRGPLQPLRVWRLEASPVKDAAAFERFCGALDGRPRVVINDMDNATRLGVANAFADQDGPPTCAWASGTSAARCAAASPTAWPPTPPAQSCRASDPLLHADALADVHRRRRSGARRRSARPAHRAAWLD